MKKFVLRIFVVLLIVIMTFIIAAGLYFGWIGPSNEYQSYNAFPRLTFDRPTGVYQYKGDNSLMYVVEMGGKLKVFENNRLTSNVHTLLDLTDRVYTSTEDGFLGLAFHPDFIDNGLFYTFHSEKNMYHENCTSCFNTILSEFQVDPDSPFTVLPGSERTLLVMNQTAAFHRAGQLMFDAEGMLIVQLGDGLQEKNVQDLTSLFGKIIRIDVDHPENGKPYGIPKDNPFYGQTNVTQEIYAYGFRNPWRGAIDPITGYLWVGDVGKDYYEEIDLVKPGLNYGWPVYEGDHCKDNASECFLANSVFPVFNYPHPSTSGIPLARASDYPVGFAVIGGMIYRGSQLNKLYGHYIFADYSGSIYDMKLTSTTKFESIHFIHRITDWISQIGFDNHGEILISSIYLGHILRLREGTPLIFISILLIYTIIWYLPFRHQVNNIIRKGITKIRKSDVE